MKKTITQPRRKWFCGNIYVVAFSIEIEYSQILFRPSDTLWLDSIRFALVQVVQPTVAIHPTQKYHKMLCQTNAPMQQSWIQPTIRLLPTNELLHYDIFPHGFWSIFFSKPISYDYVCKQWLSHRKFFNKWLWTNKNVVFFLCHKNCWRQFSIQISNTVKRTRCGWMDGSNFSTLLNLSSVNNIMLA